MGGQQPRRSQGLKVGLRGLDFGSVSTGEWGSVQMGVCWGDRHGSLDCGLHEGAEASSQATAVVPAKKGDACAKRLEEDLSSLRHLQHKSHRKDCCRCCSVAESCPTDSLLPH